MDNNENGSITPENEISPRILAQMLLEDGRQNPNLSPSINGTPNTEASTPCSQELAGLTCQPVVPAFNLGEAAMPPTKETYTTSFRTVTASHVEQKNSPFFTDSIPQNPTGYTGLVKPKALRPHEIAERQKAGKDSYPTI
ncbi:MAG: hypothetical protein PQ612_09975 [Rickettsiales bacterium]|nr:hypothetical protein [Pseudomonadota bacterium]MDA0967166.1 hypothetical protein [Pseudomonadota bacterium]MDG4544351.1 hypothetical protein [Rickettsiales bacterium]MDG4546481.1 hypothetical protein [Rickettsiales bacterium]MDG4548627.1 hypothetical protein [Rickettsiales bacterium]